MTKAKTADKAQTLVLEQGPNDDPALVLAQALLGQNVRHGFLAVNFAQPMIGHTGEHLNLKDCSSVVQQRATDAVKGDLAFASAILASQAMSLDNMFTEFARRAALNMNDYPQAMERYARLAMKAQSNSRATLEALAKLHQPREQTVRHVHVNNGGQAIVADQFHQHTGAKENGESVNQSHATGTAGASPPLPSPDAGGNALPIASGEGAEAVPDARRDEPRRA